MEAKKTVTHNLIWHSPDGAFEVILTNGVITSLAFCEPGKGGDKECTKCLTSTDYKFLKQVNVCLTEMFEFIEEENKKLGYSYPTDKTVKAIVNIEAFEKS